MIINGIKLRIATAKGDFGFVFEFSRNLTVIRAKNSSGKSTLFNSVLYGLGMEELIGGRNEKVLPYAVKEHFQFNDNRIEVVASEILLEISNSAGKVVTLRRAIRDSKRDVKLIEVFDVAYISKGGQLENPLSLYLHDAGGAKRTEGFHHFLESFLGLNLPLVPTTGGGEAKLYLQTIFASLAVEQKRGWTDYIANVPFFGIRDVRTRVVEYILGLGVFETIALRNRLNTESIEIDSSWRRIVNDFIREAASLGVGLHGISNLPTALFNKAEVSITKNSGALSISEQISQLRVEYENLGQQAENFNKITGSELLEKVKQLTDELQYLSVVHERSLALLGEQKTSLRDYDELLTTANEDLERNKSVRKLRQLGASYNLKTATGHCPTCNQDIEDSLLAEVISGPQMDLDANIAYLDSQRKMLTRQITGLKSGIRATELKVEELTARISEKRDLLVAQRNDVTSGATESKAIVRRQIQIEVEVSALEKLQLKSIEIIRQLESISNQLRINQTARQQLPKEAYSFDDLNRIELFQKNFRANAGSFGYESAQIKDVEIARDNLVPCLAQMELREIRTDIKSDSSASDFVRLIWSYLLALYQTSVTRNFEGHHPRILMLDEPGQHSMAVDSQHSLLKQLASELGLQSIIAASFDENEDVFRQATQGIDFKLIEWDGKLISLL
jgi:hypothetical protein